ncbi:MAG TPA: phosphoribosylformylglycinamidine synthase, partial [Candidatus Avacidaminococcus intestinavium]|nr:phosphoribosylformylglycinamidine synthase [Candidatus Avacidaminococcus intestinavium]
KLRKDGKLEALDVSEEINACSIVVPVKVNGETEEWLVMFKNETHNHPTEIEPFGGAATCLGGAIRDPLSGRAYVYQAMRVTGAADPRKHITETLPGKLPQRKITLGAAAGYSSYGNQIGLATGHVQEYYHDDFVAKRMELGAVIGAVPRKNVYRTEPQPGDVIILLGGRTGRDGCGGATGSSKEHTSDSLLDCAAEVQKGNPPTERKIQRLFRNPEVTLMIKRCNDFGAGGVSVACGELTDGLVINLDKVPKKYEGLDGTELAISESQERMALVIAADNVDKFIALADKENLEATVVSEVTEKRRLEMYWRGDKIVDLSRDFLDTNGLPQMAEAIVKEVGATSAFDTLPTEVAGAQNIEEAWYKNLGRLNVCSQKGLAERFDSTIGRGTVLMPFGGRYQLTPTEGMVATIPVLNGTTTTATVMSCGYNPHVAVWSPFHGAMYAIVESVARAVACGGNPANLYLTLQEFFPKLAQAETWGQPVSAVLGAFLTMMELDIAAIGGKDSMSGTFMDKNVPPTLVSFAVSTLESENALSPEFKQAGDNVVFIAPPRDVHEVIDFKVFKDILDVLHKGIVEKKILAISVVKEGGIAAALSAMCLGNKLGFEFIKPFNDTDSLFALQPGGFIVELAPGLTPEDALVDSEYIYLGTVTNEQAIYLNETKLELTLLEKTYLTTLDTVFPRQVKTTAVNKTKVDFDFIVPELPLTAPYNIASPKVFIPVFPGINCEYDTAAAFTAAGGKPEIMVVRNLTPQAIDESIAYMVNAIKNSQILALPGGFSAGDEPDGSGKFIATMLRNEYIKEAVHELLYQRDGLIIGICNGFQALIKLGLVPYGEIVDMKSDSPTLTFNTIGRHISQIVQTKVVSTKSPWLNLVEPGDIHSVAVSHGEGRFFATEAEIKHLFANGQIATQYVDQNGQPALEMPYNPNGSLYSIEGITSPDGRVFGKMGHTERYVPGLMKNIAGNKDQKIFLSGVKYFE